MKSLTDEQQKTYENAKVCYICKKIEDKHAKGEKYCIVRDYWHYTGEYSGAAHSICSLKYNGSGYDYHFIIKQLAG